MAKKSVAFKIVYLFLSKYKYYIIAEICKIVNVLLDLQCINFFSFFLLYLCIWRTLSKFVLNGKSFKNR